MCKDVYMLAKSDVKGDADLDELIAKIQYDDATATPRPEPLLEFDVFPSLEGLDDPVPVVDLFPSLEGLDDEDDEVG